MHLSKLKRARPLYALLCAGALASVTGCAATVTARPARPAVIYDYPVVYVEELPPRIYDSPSAYFRGHPAYLVNGRWYYESPDGWVYFRDEPRELRQARVTRRYERVRPPPGRRYIEERPQRRRYAEPTEGPRRRYD